MRARLVAAACIAGLGTVAVDAGASADTQIATTKRPTAIRSDLLLTLRLDRPAASRVRPLSLLAVGRQGVQDRRRELANRVGDRADNLSWAYRLGTATRRRRDS